MDRGSCGRKGRVHEGIVKGSEVYRMIYWLGEGMLESEMASPCLPMFSKAWRQDVDKCVVKSVVLMS